MSYWPMRRKSIVQVSDCRVMFDEADESLCDGKRNVCASRDQRRLAFGVHSLHLLLRKYIRFCVVVIPTISWYT